MLTVTIDPENGEDIWTVTVPEGHTMSNPSVELEKEDFDFAGWYFGDDEFDFDTPISSSITIKARWTPKAPVIIRQPESVTVSSGDTATISVEAKGADLEYRWFYRIQPDHPLPHL